MPVINYNKSKPVIFDRLKAYMLKAQSSQIQDYQYKVNFLLIIIESSNYVYKNTLERLDPQIQNNQFKFYDK